MDGQSTEGEREIGKGLGQHSREVKGKGKGKGIGTCKGKRKWEVTFTERVVLFILSDHQRDISKPETR